MGISLPPNGLQTFEHYCRHYALTLADDVPLDRALAPDFWAHCGHKLRPFDRITFMAEDRTWLAEAVVVSAGKGFAKIKLLQRYALVESVAEIEEAEETSAELYSKYKGPSDRWTVIRKSDGEKLAKNLQTKEDADRFILNYQRALA